MFAIQHETSNVVLLMALGIGQLASQRKRSVGHPPLSSLRMYKLYGIQLRRDLHPAAIPSLVPLTNFHFLFQNTESSFRAPWDQEKSNEKRFACSETMLQSPS
jgi:hypothetical protein